MTALPNVLTGPGKKGKVGRKANEQPTFDPFPSHMPDDYNIS